MALPNSGPITFQDVADEFSLPSPVSLSDFYGLAEGVPVTGEISLSMFRGKGQFIEKIITTGGENIELSTLFSDNERSSNFPKKIFIDPGVIIGSKFVDQPALRTGIMNGSLIVENYGNIHGASGSAGMNGSAGGNGGDAVLIQMASVTIDNYGAIRGGGGGGGSGGKGGKGGNGSYSFTFREPRNGNKFSQNGQKSYVYEQRYNGNVSKSEWWWNGTLLTQTFHASTFKIGNTTYFKDEVKSYETRNNPGSFQEFTYFAIHLEYPLQYETEGGDGGDYSGSFSNGGKGQGHSVSSTKGIIGLRGETGGTNAGNGGSGGNGGDGGYWGQNGQPGQGGNAGTDGNITDGLPGTLGASGGTAGRAVAGGIIYTMNNFGSIEGLY